jgi:hypothetical protein
MASGDRGKGAQNARGLHQIQPGNTIIPERWVPPTPKTDYD